MPKQMTIEQAITEVAVAIQYAKMTEDGRARAQQAVSVISEFHRDITEAVKKHS